MNAAQITALFAALLTGSKIEVGAIYGVPMKIERESGTSGNLTGLNVCLFVGTGTRCVYVKLA